MLVYTTGKHGIPSMGSRSGSLEATLMLVKPVEDGNDLIDYHTAGWDFGVTECWMVLYHVVVWGFSSFPWRQDIGTLYFILVKPPHFAISWMSRPLSVHKRRNGRVAGCGRPPYLGEFSALIREQVFGPASGQT
jgi:hypothetical protein